MNFVYIYQKSSELMILKYALCLFLLFPLIVFPQVEEVDPPDYIGTVNFKGNTPESQLPVLRLGEYLVLEFDALNVTKTIITTR